MQGKECISMALLTLVISNVLVIIDTAHFMFAGEKHSSTAHISTGKDNFKKYRNISLMLNTITLLLGGIIATIDLFVFLEFVCNSFIEKYIYLINEILFVIIFTLFYFADNQELKALGIAKQNHQKFIFNQIKILEQAMPLIDLVGLFGVLLITLISCYHHLILRKFEDLFLGISIGALVFHIILTQFNLAYLNYKYESST
jgi:hypothetical protein